MNEYLSNNKNNKPKNILILILIITTCCIIYSFSVWADEEQLQISSSLQKISEIINSYPDISSFKADRLLKEAEKAIQFGISLEDTKEIIQKSSEKKIKAYSVIGIFSLLNELAKDGLPTFPIISKAKEGFAKGISSDKIILSIREKSENLYFAKYLVEQFFLEETDIQEKSEAIEILASSFASNITEDMITDIFKEALHQKKDINEISGALNALSNLINLDMSITSAKVITEDLLREDYNPRDMMTLVNVIAYAQKNGLSVSEINSEIIHRIRKGEDALSIEEKVVDYLKEKETAIADKEDESSSTDVTSEEDAVSPTQTTPAPPSVEVTTPEETSSEEGVTTPTQTGGPDAP